jgi:hypothetical protein
VRRLEKAAARSRAAELLKLGWSYGRIAKEIGWSKGTVGRWLAPIPAPDKSRNPIAEVIPLTGPALRIPMDSTGITSSGPEISDAALTDAIDFLHRVARGEDMPDGEPATPRERIAAASILLGTSIKVRELAGKAATPTAPLLQIVADRTETG